MKHGVVDESALFAGPYEEAPLQDEDPPVMYGQGRTMAQVQSHMNGLRAFWAISGAIVALLSLGWLLDAVLPGASIF